MAESATTQVDQLLSRTVQELVISGEELPDSYFYKNRGEPGVPAPLIEIPVVDLGVLKSPATTTEELEKLRLALSSWGCFQVRYPS